MKTLPDVPPGLPQALVGWYRAARRDLPWRRTRDPYAIWVSEIMLQQTTVAAVIPYYQRFLERFPTVASLAEAPVDDVLSRWSGLGYYSRARNLKSAAEAVARDHAGRLPGTYAGLKSLPGIGDYTAGAIASIAFGQREPVLDGNVARVLTRLFALGGDPKGPLRKGLRALAAAMVPADAPGDFNQALMELGATVCTPRKPECGGCPVRAWCRATAAGEPERYPETPPRAKTVPVLVAVAVVERDGAYLLVRRRTTLMRGLMDFPGGPLPEEDAGALEKLVASEHGLSVRAGAPVAEARHAIMNRRIRLVARAATLTKAGAAAAEKQVRAGDAAWMAPAELGERGVAGLALKVFRALAKPR